MLLTCREINLFSRPTSPLTASEENLLELDWRRLWGQNGSDGAKWSYTGTNSEGQGPTINISAPPEVQDASGSSRENSRSASPRLSKREAYVTVDALKNFMIVMTDTINRQVLAQVKRATEAANSTKPLPHFDYVPTAGCEPSHRQDRVRSPRRTEREWETSRSN